MKLISLHSCVVLFLVALKSFGQVPPDINSGNPNFPFPQFKGYTGGSTTLANKNPVGVPHAEMEQRMRDAYRNICNNMKYEGSVVAGVKYIQPNNALPISHCTCVEGDGYYLLAAVYMGDKTTFDGYFMWMHDRQFQKTQRFIDGVMNSPNYYYSPGISGAGSFGNPTSPNGSALAGNSAADGDVDVALALLMAWKQWGDLSGITPPAPYTGGQISYKAEAIKYIRTMVDTLTYFPSLPQKKYISGDIGFDGYMKGGDTWNETSNWAQPGQPGFTVTPERTGGSQNYVDYLAPAYFRDFADMLQAEGQPAWGINQYRRGESSSDWVMGKAYNQGFIPWIGNYQVTDTTVNFSASNPGGEDFRYGWRTILNYLWHGAPTYTWNPTTHKFAAGTNTYNLDMANRFATFLRNPENPPYNNTCFDASASVPGLTIGGPSNIRWSYTMTGTSGGSFILPMPYGPGSPSAVVANNWDLMSQMFRQCVISFDDQGGSGAQRYLTATPQYFHEWFRLLGMLVLTGNFHSPMQIAPAANMKIYKAVDKTYAYVGDTITYTISYRNYGKPDGNNVVIKDTLDPGYKYLAGSSTKTVSASGNILTWNIGTVKGMNGGILSQTMDSLKFKVVVLPGASSRICNTAGITENGNFHWKSNEYPNHITDVMERNCVDILPAMPLSVTKTVDKSSANPGNTLTYTIVVKNNPTSFLNGGRPGVVISGAHDGVTTSQTMLDLKYRITHGAHEPLINYKNYRVSYYYVNQTPVPTWGITTTIAEGTTDPVTNINTLPTLSQQNLVPGPNWNQRFIITFPDRRATTTFRLTDNRGDASKIHEGALAPLKLVNQINAGWVNFNALDDWSAEAGIVAGDNAGFFPVTNDWTDPLNPNIPVTKLHPDQCGTISTNIKKQLVEEWDGYTWRRIYGDAPVSGRELTNIIVKDKLPVEVSFGSFVSGPTGTVSGSTITWPAIPLLLTKDSVVYKYTVTVKSPCTNPTATNTVTAKATNEPMVTSSVSTSISSCPMALQVLDFKGSVQNGMVNLEWTVTDDRAGTVYEIERSADGMSFETIGDVKSEQNSSFSHYSKSTEVLSSTTYYRLKYYDDNLVLKYTNIISVNSRIEEVQIYPNPFSGRTTILLSENFNSEILVEILDLAGKQLFLRKLVVNNGKAELSPGLSAGTYLLKVSTPDQVKSIKLISD